MPRCRIPKMSKLCEPCNPFPSELWMRFLLSPSSLHSNPDLGAIGLHPHARTFVFWRLPWVRSETPGAWPRASWMRRTRCRVLVLRFEILLLLCSGALTAEDIGWGSVHRPTHVLLFLCRPPHPPIASSCTSDFLHHPSPPRIPWGVFQNPHARWDSLVPSDGIFPAAPPPIPAPRASAGHVPPLSPPQTTGVLVVRLCLGPSRNDSNHEAIERV